MKIEGQTWGRNSYVNTQTVETKQTDRCTLSFGTMYEDTLDVFYRELADSKICGAAPKTAVTTPGHLPSASAATQAKLKELRQAAVKADYTGMSYKEIYTAIWDRYNAAFDGNMAGITSFACGSDQTAINYQFSQEVHHMAIYPMHREIRKDAGLTPQDTGYNAYVRSRYGSFSSTALGYEGMSAAEKEQAILEKYTGKDTLQDFLNLQGELIHAGVLNQKMEADAQSQYLRAIDEQLWYTCFMDHALAGTPVSQDQWNAALAGKFDVRSFAADLKERMQHLTFSGFDFDVAGAVTKGIDDLLAALERRDAV